MVAGSVSHETVPVWTVEPHDTVLLDVENTVHYDLEGPKADAEWDAMLPPKDSGIVHIGPDREPLMPSVFHQLHCLNILRRSYTARTAKVAPVAQHCLNYLRQMVLCRMDLHLERIVDPLSEHQVDIKDSQKCYDWRQMFAALGENEREYEHWKSRT